MVEEHFVNPPRINKIGQVGASKDMATYVIEVTDLKYEVRLDLRGCLEAVVTSRLPKGSIPYKQYANGEVGNRVTDLKSEVRYDLRGCLEAVVASEAAKRVHTI